MAFLHSWAETHVVYSNTIRCCHLGIYALAYSACVITTVHQYNLRWRLNKESNLKKEQRQLNQTFCELNGGNIRIVEKVQETIFGMSPKYSRYIGIAS